MMLFASVTLSSCSNDDTDLTGDLKIKLTSDNFGSYRLYSELGGLTEPSYQSEFRPSPIREGYLDEITNIYDLNQGNYYLQAFNIGKSNSEHILLQITGGKTTMVTITSNKIELEE